MDARDGMILSQRRGYEFSCKEKKKYGFSYVSEGT